MKLSDEQIDFISRLLSDSAMVSPRLCEDVLDHICTDIEHAETTVFEQALNDALERFGGIPELQKLQIRTDIALNHRANMKRKVLVYRSGYIGALLATTGVAFVLMKWPYSNLILIIAAACVAFFFLPSFLYNRYQLK
ncbi:MAG: hypothetical protein EOP48_07430 [Sphingobacteriales bacterium]|nr:MAG: hypothetical protein EOP48_07430 [Sphingobacteriales bacterium]